jgi:hypothetical protein
MMTRKDYVRTAEILGNYGDLLPASVFEDMILEFGEMFSSDNPNFDFTRFEEACWAETVTEITPLAVS